MRTDWSGMLGRTAAWVARGGLSCLGLDSPFLFLMGLVAWLIVI